MPETIGKGDRLAVPCPRCGGQLVVRQNRTQGNLFVGCWNYFDQSVNCRFSRPVADDDVVAQKAPVQEVPAGGGPAQGIHPAVRDLVDELPPEDDRDPFAPPLRVELEKAENPLMKVAELLSPERDRETVEAVRSLLARAIASVVRVVNEDYLTDADVSSQVSATLHRLGDEMRLVAEDNHCGHQHYVKLRGE